MNVIGIHDGHNASACLIKNGELIAAIGEERLTRNKHQYGFPFKSINKILEISNLSFKDIDRISMATKTLPPRYFLTQRNSNFSIKDYWREQKEYWYPVLIEGKEAIYTEIFKHHIDKKEFPYNKKLIKNEDDHVGMWEARKEHVSQFFSIDKSKIDIHDHHNSHAAYGYCTSPLYKKKPLLVFTIDGGGDNSNATVSICNEDGEIDEISRSSNCNIGRIYRAMTLLLGMRPSDHEFKVMGLAAYNTQKHADFAYQVFKETLKVDGLGFGYKIKPKDHFFYFKEKLEGERFDSIAFGLQKRTEELICNWVSNAIAKTDIKDIVISGGVSQNIKANQKILELENVNSLYIPPGPGDESISIGAGFLSSIKLNNKYINVYINYGNLKRDLNKFDDAIKLYEQALSISKENFNTFTIFE